MFKVNILLVNTITVITIICVLVSITIIPFTISFAANQIITVVIPLGASINKTAHFSQNPINIHVDDTIKWINKDTGFHTVTEGNRNDLKDASGNLNKKFSLFDSDLLFSGQTFEYTFDRRGVYNYICIIHPYMDWTINVQ